MTMTRLHSGYRSKLLRSWQQAGTQVAAHDLVMPLFVSECDDAIEPIESLPGVCRYGVDQLVAVLQPLVDIGLQAVILFGVLSDGELKNAEASAAINASGPTAKAIEVLKSSFPLLTVIADVCMCPYTSHGHCGLIDKNGLILNEESINIIADIALFYAQCGADIVAPSDMMDGRVGAIKSKLQSNGFGSKVAIMSYSSKFASSLYGPFREAARSAPGIGNRSSYQLPVGSKSLALRAFRRDCDEGADIVIVKPASWYLDIIGAIHAEALVPIAAYQVSGEYCMIYHAAEAGALDLRDLVNESLVGMKRAGANILISYFTPNILKWLSESDRNLVQLSTAQSRWDR